ncbi:MAG: hypothetical protein MUC50_05960 [Myxococcota bacterium]|jgi:hypothetical protein|nr:hypothetical protein [Myxococcota bacterium]
MTNDNTNAADSTGSTTVTRSASGKDPSESTALTYSEVISQKTVAETLVRKLLAHALGIIKDRPLTTKDLYKICQLALGSEKETVPILEGRHLRSRVSEQLSRAQRYKEPFSLLAIHLPGQIDSPSYDSVIDALAERMRDSDMLFTFKVCIVLLLPHTPKDGVQRLVGRVHTLLAATHKEGPALTMNSLTYPDPSITKRSEVLDWAEDQLRG